MKQFTTLGVWGIFALFALAGIAQLIALDQFETRLDSWTIVPGWFVPLLVLLVPTLEVGLAGLWALGIGRRVVVALLLGVAVAFGVGSAIQYARHPIPECGCLGVLAQYAKLDAGLPKLIGFNAVSVVVLAMWLSLTLADAGAGDGDGAESIERDPANPRHRSSAFTLIETILVIAIISLLLALTVPSLAKLRNGAQDAVSLSNLRQHAAVYTMYAADWNDHSPYPVHPDATLNVFRSAAVTVEVEYFWATEFWQVALADAYYGGDVFGGVFTHPADARQGTWISYRMTSSFLAHPPYWVDTPDRDTSLWGGVRVAQTRYPTGKVWIVEFNPLHTPPAPPGTGVAGQRQRDIGFAFVDAHVERLDGPELNVPLFHGDGVVEQARFSLGIFGMHTPSGVLGRDKR